MVRQAIEGQIGMLTCQVIEMGVQLQVAAARNDRLQIELQKLRLELEATRTPDTPS